MHFTGAQQAVEHAAPAGGFMAAGKEVVLSAQVMLRKGLCKVMLSIT